MPALAPLVTIVLPTYNGAALVRRALDALLAQEYPSIDILVADDVSTDDTASICEEYAARYPRIRVQRNVRNLRAWENFAQLARQASGKYLLWASQDDWWDPRFVAALVEPMERDPEFVAALSAVRFTYVNEVAPPFISRFTGKSRPDRQSRRALLKAMFSKRSADGAMNRTNMYIHGLVRTRSFQAAMAAYPGVILHERQVVCHWVLKGRLAYVDEVLCEKHKNLVPVGQRHGEEAAFVVARSSPFLALRYASDMVGSILRSGDIPAERKFWAVACAWYYLAASARKQAERALIGALPKSLLQVISGRRKAKRAP